MYMMQQVNDGGFLGPCPGFVTEKPKQTKRARKALRRLENKRKAKPSKAALIEQARRREADLMASMPWMRQPVRKVYTVNTKTGEVI